MKLKTNSNLNRDNKAFISLFYVGIVLLLLAGFFEFVFPEDAFNNHIGFIINVSLGLSASSLISSATIYFPFSKIREEEKIKFNASVRKIYTKYKLIYNNLEKCDSQSAKININELEEQIKVFAIEYNKMNFICDEFENKFKIITDTLLNAINDITYYLQIVDIYIDDKLGEFYSEEEISVISKTVFNTVIDCVDEHKIPRLCSDYETIGESTGFLLNDLKEISDGLLLINKQKMRLQDSKKIEKTYHQIVNAIAMDKGKM